MAKKNPLSNWTTLNLVINTLSERRIKELLNEEINDARRRTFVIRLHVRLCTLRASRERRTLLKKLANKKGSKNELGKRTK